MGRQGTRVVLLPVLSPYCSALLNSTQLVLRVCQAVLVAEYSQIVLLHALL